MKPIQAVLIGAGNRGAEAYAPYALRHPEQICFVAVAEPDPDRRARFAATHSIPAEDQYESWEPLLAHPQYGQAAIIATQDWQHTAPALAAMAAGYDVLLEKPMATTREECLQLVQAAETTGRRLNICHVLRYTNHFVKMREIIQSGVLGDVVDVVHRENVGYWHMAHSYVRGNWRNREQSSPMILAKCCHDLDILYWLLGSPVTNLNSYGSLMHYRAENAPPGAPLRCTDGCPVADACPYFAPRLYVDMLPFWQTYAETAEGFNRLAVETYLKQPGLFRAAASVAPYLRQVSEYSGWPRTVVQANPTNENLLEALRTGPYGRCVYHCDNDVVDHQVVSMRLENNVTVTLGMHGHSHVEYRTTRIEGTRGRLLAEFGAGGSWIEVAEHHPDRHTRYNTSPSENAGHGGGDYFLMQAFVRSLNGDAQAARTTAREALESHLLAFAAEQSRVEGRNLQRAEF